MSYPCRSSGSRIEVSLINYIFLVLTLSTFCCSRTELPSVEEIEGAYPIAEILVEAEALSIEGAPGTTLDDLMDLKMFDRFFPGMSFQQAYELVGEPDKRGAARGGAAWFYDCPGGTIQIVDQFNQSGDSESGYVYYTLRIKLRVPDMNILLREAVVLQIFGLERNKIILTSSDGGLGFVAREDDGMFAYWIE